MGNGPSGAVDITEAVRGLGRQLRLIEIGDPLRLLLVVPAANARMAAVNAASQARTSPVRASARASIAWNCARRVGVATWAMPIRAARASVAASVYRPRNVA
jgi:hypothetical protein